MRRLILTVILLCLCAAASASGTYAFRNGVVTTGDSIPAVLKRAGKPDRIVQLENEYGAAVGERWEYYFDGKSVSLIFSGGRVVAIEEVR